MHCWFSVCGNGFLDNAQGIVGSGYLDSRFSPFGLTPNMNGLANSTHPEGESRFDTRFDLLEKVDGALRVDSPLGEDARVPVTSLPKVLQAWMRYRERAALPPELFAPNVTLITYPPSLTQLKPFKLARPEVGRRVIAEAYRTALAALSKRPPRA